MTNLSTLGSGLAFLQDYRSGHAANQAGYNGGVGAGVVNGTRGRFRTGYGFETTHDFVGAGQSSLGYIRSATAGAFHPPVGGMCLIASYIQADSAVSCQILGVGSDAVNNISWQLIRTPAKIKFITSDGVATSEFNYAIAAVPGQIETVAVRYLGGVGANNCIIAVASPVPSSSTGQIDRVPQAALQPLSVCCYSATPAYPFFGTMRYAAYIRGAQSNAIITDLINAIENCTWPRELAYKDQSGSVADRNVQYMTKFGVDASIADEGGVVNGELSNSRWSFRDANTLWRVQPLHTAHSAVGSPADICKALMCHADGLLELPTERFAVGVTPTLAAFGTWDFWVQHDTSAVLNTWLVHTMSGANNYGYYVTIGAVDIYLRYSDAAGAVTDLLKVSNVLGLAQVVRVRITRTTPAGLWKLFYQVESATGVPDKWHAAGSATEVTLTTSDRMMLNYTANSAFLLGNHRSEKAFFKWKGVVNPL